MLLMLLAMAGGETRAQWKIVPNILASNVGAMCFRDGIVWIASNNLYQSLDSGLTWTMVTHIPGVLRDVDFIDRSHGIISSNTATYFTSNGGISTRSFGFGSLSSCFGKDTLTIGAAESDGFGGGNLMVSSDGGNTWINHASYGQPLCVRRLPMSWTMPNALVFYSGSKAGGFLTWTSDQGITWASDTGGIDWDSWTFAPDSCDPNRIYLSHEDAGFQTDKFSKIFLSTDLGNTWQAVAKDSEPYFSGSVVAGKEAIYCQSVANGIFRSLDRGMTWISIGGPSNITDTRFMAAIDDNIIVAVDNQGNVWRTDNSGGDSVKLAPGLGTLTLSTNALFTTDTLSCGDSAVEPILTQSSGCIPPFVARARVVGTDSANYHVAFIGLDSIAVVFQPQESGQYQSNLVLTLGDGTSDTVALGGNSIGGNAPLTMMTADQKTDTIGATVSVPIQFIGLLGAETIDVVMHYTGADLVYDSSVDLSGMKIDVPGEQWPGRSMLYLTNVQSGVIAGYARFNVFSDSTSKPLVTFDSVQIQAAGCKYQTPAPVTSTITPVQGCGVPLVSELMLTGHIPNLNIIPNPTTGDVLISSSSDVGDATIEIYDMLGTLRSQTEMTLAANAPTKLTLPPVDGMYTIRVRSVAGVFSERVIVRR
jgi:photosystem II stability/assembly factor-like uncharacterized protein